MMVFSTTRWKFEENLGFPKGVSVKQMGIQGSCKILSLHQALFSSFCLFSALR
ncbi:hypothetical protein SLEP1_g49560 [Rubroshorea leprosula]|uniref:Uncharacterized protein n=1 Tax=Rubroshorea leprosula TaxID=152421 RepID=A0AAV5LY57_9ROSI|nr:hypothetical protein SLEP1_g49560 [Rubroshorea leprosula]